MVLSFRVNFELDVGNNQTSNQNRPENSEHRGAHDIG